ncbi:hypothetical protein [Brevibacillus parabrevis]|uniref:hypothetical protein n=1 Tax=Brevibacillus parabrevis TaxID=54914 RepID=UPI001F6024FA|nr:hypothetical protein [Brevibacillus parabrevis]
MEEIVYYASTCSHYVAKGRERAKMNEIAAQYEQKVEEEDRLIDSIQTCEAYMLVLLEHTYQKGMQYHKEAMEKILMALHTVCNDWRTDLLHAQLAKALLSCQMKQGETK